MAWLPRPRTRTARVGAAMPVAVLALLALSLAWPATAQASAYRYWTYWQGSAASWTFATAGPASLVPADGAVEGWAFGVTTASGNSDDAPSATADFEAICGKTPAQADRKRVALVVDPGPPALAPDGQAPPAAISTCVSIEPDATGYQVLRSVTTVRTEDGLVCGITDYPLGECAVVLDDAEAADLLARVSATESAPPATSDTTGMEPGSASGNDSGSGSPIATLVVVAVLIGAAAFGLGRLRRAR